MAKKKQTIKDESLSSGTSQYLVEKKQDTKTAGRPTGQRSERTKKIVQFIDEHFNNMQSNTTCNNHDLVRLLDEKGMDVSSVAIPTDVPLNYAPKTEAMKNGVVIKEKDDPNKKRPMWLYRKV